MLFVTNRTPRQSNKTRRNRNISFDLQDTTASQNMFFCERMGADDYVEVGSEAFFSRLKALPEKTEILLYIHGFNNTGEANIFPNARKLQELFDREGGEGLVHVVPLIWPCDDDAVTAIIDDYWDDQRAADLSGVAFARLMGKFDAWRRSEAQLETPCTKRIHLLAHSMGNRVLRNALHTWAKFDGHGEVPQIFRNIFMIAADVVNHALEEGEDGRFIPQAARNVVVYFANDDLAMPASKVANLRNRSTSRRLGMTGLNDPEVVARNVYEVDCDNFNNGIDSPLGHSYFLESKNGVLSPVLTHMVEAVKNPRIRERYTELPRPAAL